MSESLYLTFTSTPISQAVNDKAPIWTVRVPAGINAAELEELVHYAQGKLEEADDGAH